MIKVSRNINMGRCNGNVGVTRGIIDSVIQAYANQPLQLIALELFLAFLTVLCTPIAILYYNCEFVSQFILYIWHNLQLAIMACVGLFVSIVMIISIGIVLLLLYIAINNICR